MQTAAVIAERDHEILMLKAELACMPSANSSSPLRMTYTLGQREQLEVHDNQMAATEADRDATRTEVRKYHYP